VVIEIKDNAVTIDLNHPRAGQDLHYVGTVVESREATNDEITGRLNMMSGEGCGCCGSDCGGDCGGGHDSGCGCGHCH
jgi:FKBP-type peptidyl-prolyl cis-trans isomerase SlyD